MKAAPPALPAQSDAWQLLELRARIGMIDTQLLALLARRFDVVRQIRLVKENSGLPLRDADREHEVLAHCLDLAATLNVPAEIVRALYQQLFEATRGSIASSLDARQGDACTASTECAQAPELRR